VRRWGCRLHRMGCECRGGFDAIVSCVCVSSCKIVGRPYFVVHVNVSVVYLLSE